MNIHFDYKKIYGLPLGGYYFCCCRYFKMELFSNASSIFYTLSTRDFCSKNSLSDFVMMMFSIKSFYVNTRLQEVPDVLCRQASQDRVPPTLFSERTLHLQPRTKFNDDQMRSPFQTQHPALSSYTPPLHYVFRKKYNFPCIFVLHSSTHSNYY